MAQGPGEVEATLLRTDDPSAAATAAAPTTDDIRSQIEQTRAEMSDTIDAIQTRLSPARAIADAKDSVMDATVGRLGRLAQQTPGSSGLLATARANPWPVSLLTTAAVALIVRGLNSGSSRRPKPSRTRNDGGHRELRERITPATLSSKRLLLAASAGATCWAIWRVQTAASHS